MDLLHSGYNGSILLFRGAADRRFDAASPLRLKTGKQLFVDKLKFVLVRDWNGDGRLDLITFTERNTRLYPGTEDGTFEEPTPIQVDGKEILFRYATADIADWDGDGIPDLWTGSEDGGAFFFKGTGETSGERAFHAPVPHLTPPFSLIPPVAYVPRLSDLPSVSPSITGESTHITLWDWNGDGLLDLVIGDMRAALVQPEDPTPELSEKIDAFLGAQNAFQAFMEGPRATLPANYGTLSPAERMQIRNQTARDLSSVSHFQQLSKNLFQKNSELRQQRLLKRHGLVWIYLQKPPTEDSPKS